MPLAVGQAARGAALVVGTVETDVLAVEAVVKLGAPLVILVVVVDVETDAEVEALLLVAAKVVLVFVLLADRLLGVEAVELVKVVVD